MVRLRMCCAVPGVVLSSCHSWVWGSSEFARELRGCIKRGENTFTHKWKQQVRSGAPVASACLNVEV